MCSPNRSFLRLGDALVEDQRTADTTSTRTALPRASPASRWGRCVPTYGKPSAPGTSSCQFLQPGSLVRGIWRAKICPVCAGLLLFGEGRAFEVAAEIWSLAPDRNRERNHQPFVPFWLLQKDNVRQERAASHAITSS